MKHKLLFLLVALLPTAMAWAEVEINETNFPDENFRNWILSQDYGANGVLTDAEIAGITKIKLNSRNIQSLKGIEYFTALEELSCSNSQLTTLDMSQNTALTFLNCANNQLTTLDVSQNKALEKLYSANNLLTTLDMSPNTALTGLYCSNNQLTTLDVSQNTALTSLSCANNQLTTLDVSQNTALTSLDCSNNQLTTLDVSQNTALTRLNCYSNQLTRLDVSKNTKLTSLECYNNQLTTLYVSQNTALTSLNCYQNQIKGAEMDALVDSLPTVSSGMMRVIYSENDQNEMTTTQVAAAKAKGWKPYWYINDKFWEYAGSEQISSSIVINSTNFPDKNFRNWVLSQEYGADVVLTDDEIASIQRIDVTKKDIRSLKGIEYFTALTSLSCSFNQLTTLDVTNNTALTQLFCNYNQLTTLDVSKNTALEILECTSNQLTTLDVSQNTALTSLSCGQNLLTALDVSQNTTLEMLECYNNQLTTLDVSKNTALKELYCGINQLTALDVSKNTALAILACNDNQIKGMSMDALVESLPTINKGKLRVIGDRNDQNEMTTIQVAAAKAKGWTAYYYDNSKWNWMEYAGSEPTDIEEFIVDNLKYRVLHQTETRASVRKAEGQNVVELVGCVTSPTGAVDIPASVKHDGVDYAVTSIGENAFTNCSGMTSVTIPSSVTNIEDGAFEGCTGLTDVYCNADPAQLTWSADAQSFMADKATKFHVEDASAWSAFSDANVTFVGDLEPDAIESIAAADTADGAWYTLNGVKLEGEPTEKGIYVKDGKKVVVK